MHYALCTATFHCQHKLHGLGHALLPATHQSWVHCFLCFAMHCAEIYNASTVNTAPLLRIEGFFDLSGTKSLGGFLPAGSKFSLQSDTTSNKWVQRWVDFTMHHAAQVWSGRGSWNSSQWKTMDSTPVSLETRKENDFTLQLIMSLPLVINYSKGWWCPHKTKPG